MGLNNIIISNGPSKKGLQRDLSKMPEAITLTFAQRSNIGTVVFRLSDYTIDQVSYFLKY